MSTIVLACETLRDEYEYVTGKLGVEHETRWLESGLHNSPNKLRERLQEQLDSFDGYDTVLMVFGSCGNSVIGLETGGYTLVVPRVDDCITMLIGSLKDRVRINAEGGTYFMTPGWLRGERNLWVEYTHAVNKYGEETAEEIMGSLLAHYEYLGLLETECCNIDTVMPEIDSMAKDLKLKSRTIPATAGYLFELLTGPWPAERFAVFPPHSKITEFQLSVTG